MQPIRKPFFLDPIFPFEMVYKGLFIDDVICEKEQGDLFLIPGNTIHRAFPSAIEPIVCKQSHLRALRLSKKACVSASHLA